MTPRPATPACPLPDATDRHAVGVDPALKQSNLRRLSRIEGQLRGIQRMIEEGQTCLDIASQMAAVRKALDSTYVRMTMCFVEQELGSRLGDEPGSKDHLGHMLEEMQVLLGKVR